MLNCSFFSLTLYSFLIFAPLLVTHGCEFVNLFLNEIRIGILFFKLSDLINIGLTVFDWV